MKRTGARVACFRVFWPFWLTQEPSSSHPSGDEGLVRVEEPHGVTRTLSMLVYPSSERQGRCPCWYPNRPGGKDACHPYWAWLAMVFGPRGTGRTAGAHDHLRVFWPVSCSRQRAMRTADRGRHLASRRGRYLWASRRSRLQSVTKRGA